jgi:hypothetical protein
MSKLRSLSGYVVAALLVTACGGGDEPAARPPEVASDEGVATDAEAEPEAEPVDEPVEAVAAPATDTVSDDGRLTISPPTDGSVITATAIEASIEPDQPGAAVAAYELGPDGSTFDPPLVARLTVEPEVLNDGLAIAHVDSDGTVTSLDFEIDNNDIVFELESFSQVRVFHLNHQTITMTAPGTAYVGEPFQVTATVDAQISTNARISLDSLSASGKVAVEGDSFVCSEKGTGTAKHAGRLAVETDDGAGVLFLRYWFTDFEREFVVECLEPPVPIEPTDYRCTERATGLETTGCTSPDTLGAQVVVSSDGSIEIQMIDVHDATETCGFGVGDGDNFRYVESEPGNFQGWDTNSFLNFEPDGVLPEASIGPAIGTHSRSNDDEIVRCGHIPAQSGPDGELMLTLPGGLRNDGERIDPLTAPVVDISIFIEDRDGTFGIYFFDPTNPSVNAAFASVG